MTEAPLRRRRRDSRGATVVEAALGTGLLLLLVFGIIEFGIAWERNHAVSQGVRETARNGVVGDVDPDGVCGGAGDDMAMIACQAADRIGNSAGVRVVLSGGATVDDGQELTVCAQTTYNAVTGLLNPFLDGAVLDSSATLRVEQPLSGTSAVLGNAPGSCS